MSPTRSIVLVGGPGAGKTTVAGLLAEALAMTHHDSDAVVEDVLGLSLSEAYASLPSQVLRTAEASVCASLLDLDASVISLGSAAVEDSGTRAALSGHQVVWLKVSSSPATRRLGLVGLGMDTLKAVRAKLDADLRTRRHWYEGVSTMTIDTDRLAADEVARRIVAAERGGT
ncbi:MAG: shikimate kinase [Propionicimonas sp.]